MSGGRPTERGARPDRRPSFGQEVDRADRPGGWRERSPRENRGTERSPSPRGGPADRPRHDRSSGQDRPAAREPRSWGNERRGGSAGDPGHRARTDDRAGVGRRNREGAGDWRERRPTPRGGGSPDRSDDRPRRPTGPELPDWAEARDLDAAVRSALRGLDARNAERVARHLVAAGTLVDEDAEAALAHARAARDRASRVAAVREAVGVAAYHAGDYAEAARELRAYRRMSGDDSYRAVLADCERALGRPEVALRLVAEALAGSADAEEVAELRLVEAGVRSDLGEPAAARLILERALGGRPHPGMVADADATTLRTAAAYADLLAVQGDQDRAAEWAAALAEVDPEGLLGIGEGPQVTFSEEDVEEPAGDEGDDASGRVPADGPPGDEASDAEETSTPEGFAAEVEAEVAELLGESEGGGEQSGQESGQESGQADDGGEVGEVADSTEH